ncbi:photosystem II stability/assembly factor-like uncharacterized protein [Paraburkholderia unamae]|uniref:WD40/YVTN/BNR-like repeat-containing protein n=1 Tax=Paraburkholderia unamae TaxID=219649 RepID=UPI000DC44F79|nr:YCF48-related protein [Paraburkholderia unamae]RAR57875.1 photosystem II stability/assembly factor-like uncharacterized protein [Paraburkholderia unamae]
MWGSAVGVCVAALLAAAPAHAFENPERTPAMSSTLAARSPLIGTARAGKRIVAVGLRGHIVYSDDEGKNWRQASVPVSTDLVAVSFPTAQQGWAVGHGGIVIHSVDGGATWTKQMDGERFSALAVSYYGKLQQTNASPETKRALNQAQTLATDGSTRALLDVYFDSETSGFVVGTFNRIYRTEDGGNTWTPWMERSGNPRELHFYSIRGENGRVLLTGEQGMVWQLDATRTHFEPIQTPYKGTLFGSVLSGADIFVFGMRGSLFHSADSGRTWEKVKVPSEAGITGGMALGPGRMLLVNQAGTVLYTGDDGKSFETVKLPHPMAYYGVGDAPDGNIALAGSRGVRVEALPEADRAATRGAN